MERQELSTLLKKQLYGTIKHQEFLQLKKMILTLDEHLVEQCLFEVWETYSATDKRNQVSYEMVKENLKRIIQPQSKTEVQVPIQTKKTIPFLFYALRVAAVILIPLMLSFGVYFYTKRSTIADLAKSHYTIETSSGERTHLTLPDGTRVMVSANTTFTYPATFGKDNRKVSLSGEAYFDVTHNADLPFIVKSKKMNIKVLGTKFNIYAYPNENYFEASLVEGKIQAYSTGTKKTIMTLLPNEKVRYHYASETFEKTSTDLKVETAWTRGDLYFQSETLLSILPKLERYYGVKFDIDGQLPSQMLTTSYHETDINEILRNLSVHFRLSYSKNGNVVHLKFN